jgi:hypothetical protein
MNMLASLDAEFATKLPQSHRRHPAVFEQARVSFDTVEWPCGVDLDPAFVYAKCRMHSAA